MIACARHVGCFNFVGEISKREDSGKPDGGTGGVKLSLCDLKGHGHTCQFTLTTSIPSTETDIAATAPRVARAALDRREQYWWINWWIPTAASHGDHYEGPPLGIIGRL